MNTGLGFGGAVFGRGTHGKGVMQSFADTASASSVSFFGVAIWESPHSEVESESSLTDFGGLLKGGTTSIFASTVAEDRPNLQWAGFGSDSIPTVVSTHGFIAWDGQVVADSVWTTQNVD